MNLFLLSKPREWRLLLLMTMALFQLTAFAQNAEKQISGKVVDVNKQPIVGATVLIKNPQDPNSQVRGTVTDALGKFSIKASDDQLLVVQYIGYKTVEMPIAKFTGTTIVLIEDATNLEDVVVVGYGVRKKEALTGAISNINSKALLTTTSSSLAQNLQGKVSGLQIRQNSGEPGDFNTMINIRGFGNPLYVIDGIPQDLGGNDFQRLNPQDIESISIVKDASSAIYGRRAANGVVIVTTNKGSKGAPKFNYNMVFGWQQPTDMPRMATRAEWAMMRNDANINAGSAPYFTPEELAAEIGGSNTDWYGLTMKDFSTQMQHNISASGGNEKTSYYISLGYVQDNGLLKSGDLKYDKYTFRSNITTQLTKNIKGEMNVSGRYDKKDSPSLGFHNIFYATRTAMPGSPAYANDNAEYLAYQRFLHPLALADKDISGYTQDKNQLISASMSLQYDAPFLKGLSFKGIGSYSNNRVLNKSLSKTYRLYNYDESSDNPYVEAAKKNDPSTISNASTDIDMLTLQGYITYSKKIAEDHSIDATLVYEQHTYKSRVSGLSRKYSFYTNDQIDLASKNDMENNGIESEQANASLIGRLNYSFRGKYLLEYGFRYDGSYRYHPDLRWDIFQSFSAGWRISEEAFMKNVKFISNLKLRGSYGILGEDAGDPFQYVLGYSLTGGKGYEFVNGQWTDGAKSPSIVNPNLSWFTAYTTNIGIDIGLFRNSLAIEADIYQRDREGLLSYRNLTLPNTFGGTLPQENLNSDRTQGFELAVSYNNKVGDFYYGIRGNFNFARTMNRYVERGAYANSMDKWRNGSDYRWNDIAWGYIVEDRFSGEEMIITAPAQNGKQGNTLTLPGDYKYRDVNEDGIIDGNDVVPLFYSGNPKFHYGITLSASYKGFDFNALLQGSGRYTVRFKEVYAEMLAFDLNTPAYFADRWHKADPYDANSAWIPGKWPATRLAANAGSLYHESEIWRKDASYFRLKSVELGYTLPSKYLKGVGIESFRVFFTAHNLLTFTDSFVKAFDPEKIEGANSSGFTYPLTRSFNIGVNINF